MVEHFPHIIAGTGPGLVRTRRGRRCRGELRHHPRRPRHHPHGRRRRLPEQRTHPRSKVPLRLDELADTLVRTAGDAGLDRFAVLGHSLGTAAAVRATLRHPDRVSGLILTAGFAFPDDRMRLATEAWQSLLGHGDRTLSAKYLTLASAGQGMPNAATGLDESVVALADSLPPGGPGQVTLVSEVDTVDTRADLAGITVPTLVVVATTPDGLTGADHSRELGAGIPGARLGEIAAGHAINVAARDEWLAVIREFPGRQDGKPWNCN